VRPYQQQQQQQQQQHPYSSSSSGGGTHTAHHDNHHHDDVASELFYDMDEAEAETLASPAPATATEENDTTLLGVPTLVNGFPSVSVSVYEAARAMALRGEITCRKNRTEETGCVNTVDFLTRLHCVRQATTVCGVGEERGSEFFT
jgi:hypothetical protein